MTETRKYDVEICVTKDQLSYLVDNGVKATDMARILGICALRVNFARASVFSSAVRILAAAIGVSSSVSPISTLHLCTATFLWTANVVFPCFCHTQQ